MLSEPTTIGIYIGIVLSAIFLIIHAFKKQAPRLSQVAVILLGAVGGTLGIDFGYVVLTSKPETFGIFKDQRITMLLGALAVVWTSCESLIETYAAIGKSKGATMKDKAQGSPGTASGMAAVSHK